MHSQAQKDGIVRAKIEQFSLGGGWRAARIICSDCQIFVAAMATGWQE